jgi:hypothetical protein
MTPSKFIDYQERRLGRSLSAEELQAVLKARGASDSGRRDTLRAMRAALQELLPPHELGPEDRPRKQRRPTNDDKAAKIWPNDYDAPADVRTFEGSVLLAGPGSLTASFPPDAAEATGRLMIQAAEHARQHVAKGDDS